MDFIALFRSILEQLSCATFISQRGCALAEPDGPWRLTFALGRLGNLIFYIQSYAGHPRFYSFRALGSFQFPLEHSLGQGAFTRKDCLMQT